MCFFSTEYVKSDASTVMVKSVAFSVVIFQWFTCFIMILSSFPEYMVLCGLILVGAALFLPLFWVKYNHLKRGKIEEKGEGMCLEAYEHPLEESCESYLKGRG